MSIAHNCIWQGELKIGSTIILNRNKRFFCR